MPAMTAAAAKYQVSCMVSQLELKGPKWSLELLYASILCVTAVSRSWNRAGTAVIAVEQGIGLRLLSRGGAEQMTQQSTNLLLVYMFIASRLHAFCASIIIVFEFG